MKYMDRQVVYSTEYSFFPLTGDSGVVRNRKHEKIDKSEKKINFRGTVMGMGLYGAQSSALASSRDMMQRLAVVLSPQTYV